MKIKTDLQYIARMGKIRDDENWEFRNFLKQIDMDGDVLDRLVHHITAEVSAQIDCTKCGNCCKQIPPILDQDDVSRFAIGLDLPILEFEGDFLKSADEPAKFQFNALPCPFLKENRCTNYEHRPHDCRSYPHLNKDDFVFRLWGVLANYSICPIVFNVYERLKEELW